MISLALQIGLAATMGVPQVAPCPGTAAIDVPEGEVAVEYIAHASFRLHLRSGCVILIDPFAGHVWIGYDFPAGLTADAVAITHPHFDHDAGRFRGMPFPWPSAAMFDRPGSRDFGGATLTGVRGKHADPYGKEFGQRNTIWVIEAAGIRFAHLGDNGPLTPSQVEAMGRVDVLFVPIDAEEHIISFETVRETRRALRPMVVVPMHYRLGAFEEPGAPEDLGDIDPWLENQPRVRRLGTHLLRLSSADLPAASEVWVFDPTPSIRPGRQ